MKKLMTCFLAALGLTSAYGQQNFETDEFPTQSEYPVRFHALMHGSIRIEHGGLEIEIDPVAKLGNRTVDYSAMPEADLILVTHEHGDHFDPQTIKQLSTDNTIVVMNPRCHELSGLGQPLSNRMTLNFAEDVTVEAVPAYNTTEGRTQFHPKGRDNGYILTLDGFRIYIAGDTEDIPEMEALNDIDVAFLPCNQPYTMTIEQLVKAAKIIKPKVLFPYHYGQTDVSTLPSLLEGAGIDVRIRHYE